MRSLNRKTHNEDCASCESDFEDGDTLVAFQVVGVEDEFIVDKGLCLKCFGRKLGE